MGHQKLDYCFSVHLVLFEILSLDGYEIYSSVRYFLNNLISKRHEGLIDQLNIRFIL